jgi:hypothetical protein
METVSANVISTAAMIPIFRVGPCYWIISSYARSGHMGPAGSGCGQCLGPKTTNGGEGDTVRLAVIFDRPVVLRPHHLEWLRGRAQIIGDRIVLDRATAERYQPAGEWNLLFDLAAVRRPEDAVAFVSRYGLLRHGRGAADTQEPFSAWLETAYTFTNLLDLYHLIAGARYGDPASLATLWDEWSDRFQPIVESAPSTNEELLAGASRALAWLVTEGLRNAQFQVDMLTDAPGIGDDHRWDLGSFALAPRCRNLGELAYVVLAMMLCLRTPLRTCAECGRHFAPRNRLQRFHDRACAVRGRRRRDQQLPATTQADPERTAERAKGVPSLAFSLPRPAGVRPRRPPPADREAAG